VGEPRRRQPVGHAERQTGTLLQRAQQRGLPYPGLAPYQRDRPMATPSALGQRYQSLKLYLALEQPLHVRDRNLDATWAQGIADRRRELA
jgi:hypothetical protein